MPAVPHKKWPMADESTVWRWNAAAQNAILDRGGWELYRQAHAWYDEAKSETKDGYKLPHHLADGDGGLVTVWRGVVAGMAALLGARGGVDIPTDDREEVYGHLAKHYEEFGREAPPLLASMTAAEFREFHAKQGVSDAVIAFALGEAKPLVLAENPRSDWPTSWFDAFKEGRLWYAEAEEWFRIDRDMLEDLAASVRDASQPVPIDGGGISEVHGSVYDSASEAAGWVFDAQVIEHPDGVAHLWLRAAVHPQVAGLIEDGRILYGSVAIDRSDDPESGQRYWRLHSYALTNKPRVHGLTPHRMFRERPEPPVPAEITAEDGLQGADSLLDSTEGVSEMEQEKTVQSCDCSERVAELSERLSRMEAELFVVRAEAELGALNEERKATLLRLVCADRQAAEEFVAALRCAQPPAGRKAPKEEPERQERPRDLEALFAEKAAESEDAVAALEATFAEAGVSIRDVLLGE